MENSKYRQNDHLGVNKIGKNIRKSPIHQPNFAENAVNRQQPQPKVYNISKSDFRSIVQQLTGSTSQQPLPTPPQNPPKPPSMRLQKIKPPPLTPINRPHIPVPVPAPAPAPAPPPAPPQVPSNGSFAQPGQYGQPPPTAMMPPLTPGESFWANTAESPISAYMRYLQVSIMDPCSRESQAHSWTQQQRQVPGQFWPSLPTSGLPPRSPMPRLPSPQANGLVPPMSNHPPSSTNGPALLPSPSSQFLLPSPTGYMNLLSPLYPLLSPGVQYPPPMTPNFTFSPMARSGILGPGPQPPGSPGLLFPLSPSGFFPSSSPTWRNP